MNRQQAYKKAIEFMNSKIGGHTVELEEVPSIEVFEVFLISDGKLSSKVFSYKDKPMDKQTAQRLFDAAAESLGCHFCPIKHECPRGPNACKENLYKAAQALCSDNTMDNLTPP